MPTRFLLANISFLDVPVRFSHAPSFQKCEPDLLAFSRVGVLMTLVILCFFNIANAQHATIPNPSLPTIRAASMPSPMTGLQSGVDPQEAQRREIQWVDEQIRKNDPTMRKIYGTLDVSEVKTDNNMRYEFPANNDGGRRRFDNAFKEIQEMVGGQKPYSLKRAVYLTEQAYDTTLNFEQFEKQIGKVVSIIQLEMQQRKISPNDNIGKIMSIFKFMADTLHVKNPVTEKFKYWGGSQFGFFKQFVEVFTR